MVFRIYPSGEWIQSQVPEVVRHCINGLTDEMDDVNDTDAEAFVQAFVNVVVGACISLGRLSTLTPTKYLLTIFFISILFWWFTCESFVPKSLLAQIVSYL